jgi:hypothetical protein
MYVSSGTLGMADILKYLALWDHSGNVPHGIVTVQLHVPVHARLTNLFSSSNSAQCVFDED